MSEISCIVCSETQKHFQKKGTYITMEVPQQVNPFQNVLNPSLLLIRLSKYLPKVTPKEFERKTKREKRQR